MSTNSPKNHSADLADPELRQADTAAVLEEFFCGIQLDAKTAERIHARAEQITEDIRRARGLVDDDTFQSLLDDEA
jgi:hypothetical protein